MGLLQQAWMEKTFHGVQTYWLPGKEKKKFLTQQLVNKMLIVFWGMKGPITINFLEKGATVNSTSYF